MSNIRGLADYRNDRANDPRRYRQEGERPDRSGYAPPPEQDDAPRGGGVPMGDDGPEPVKSIRALIFPRFKWATFTCFISIVDVLVMIAVLVVGQTQFSGAFVMGNSMAGPDTATLDYMGGKSVPEIRAGQWWRLVTPIVLHAGILHLVMNLLFQLHFGFTFELRWGLWRFFAVYLVTGLGASLMSCCVSASSVSVGASGALFGLLGADFTYLIINWNSIPGNASEMCMLVMVMLMNFIILLVPAGPGAANPVDWAAHLGGLLAGVFAGAFLTPTLHPSYNTPWYKYTCTFLAFVFFGLLGTLLAENIVKY